MISLASMMSVSNLSTIGFLEDEEADDYNYWSVDIPPLLLAKDRALFAPHSVVLVLSTMIIIFRHVHALWVCIVRM